MKIENKILDQEQEKVVLDNNNQLVIAGAGCGKTLTLLAKADYLLKINKNIKILILTYTNEAQDDLNKRLRKLEIKNLTCYTFHKFASKFVNLDDVSFEEENEFLIFLNNYFNNPNDVSLIIEIFINYLYDISSNFRLSLDMFYNELNYKKWIKRNKYISSFFKNDFEFYSYIKQIRPEYFKKLKELLICYHEHIIRNECDFTNTVRTTKINNLYQEIIKEYKKNNKISYEDIINIAINIIKNNNLKEEFSYDYIFIDEYQDISKNRFLLILELYKKSKAKISFFGDDYQAIYHFNGGNLDYLLNLKNYIPNIKLYIINKTYRFSKNLISYTKNLMQHNSYQIKKNLISLKIKRDPIILIEYTNNQKEKIKKVLDYLNKLKQDKILSVFILGRYKKDKNILDFLNKSLIEDNLFVDYDNLNVYFKTLHQAKGLEADYVLIINLTDLLFPCLKESDSIFKPYKNLLEEERRLFYVGITRTKNQVFLFYPKMNKSRFISELKL